MANVDSLRNRPLIDPKYTKDPLVTESKYVITKVHLGA